MMIGRNVYNTTNIFVLILTRRLPACDPSCFCTVYFRRAPMGLTECLAAALWRSRFPHQVHLDFIHGKSLGIPCAASFLLLIGRSLRVLCACHCYALASVCVCVCYVAFSHCE